MCAFQNWACIHVSRCALTVGPRSMCSGSVLAAPLRAHIIIIIIVYYYFYIRWVVTVGSTGYGCPHRRVRIGARFWGPGHVTYQVYRTVFCPTLRSLRVRTYYARVSASPPPVAILR